MKIGSFEVPEIRLVPNCVQDIKKIYDTVSFETISSKDLSKLFGYKNSTSGRFYLRLKSLINYGLIQSGNTVTELGYQLAYPESPEDEKRSREVAVLHVSLWKELYLQIGNNTPDAFWIPLKKAAKIDAPTAQKHAKLIKKWYSEDASYVYDDSKSDNKQNEEYLRSSTTQDNQMSQQMVQSDDMEFIKFDKYQVILPKGDLKKEWKILSKYMEIKLEDYEEKTKDITTNIELDYENSEEKSELTPIEKMRQLEADRESQDE